MEMEIFVLSVGICNACAQLELGDYPNDLAQFARFGSRELKSENRIPAAHEALPSIASPS